MTSDAPNALAETITAIERSYEFMLAYAAQGRDFEDSSGSGPAIRQYLTRLREGLATIASLVEGHASEPGKGPVFASYVDVIRIDADLVTDLDGARASDSENGRERDLSHRPNPRNILTLSLSLFYY